MTDHFAVLSAEFTEEPYRVEIPTKGKFTIPHVNSVSVFELNEAIGAGDGDLDVIERVFRLVMPEKEFDRLRKAKINRATFIALYDAWLKHCGTPAGESPASSA